MEVSCTWKCPRHNCCGMCLTTTARHKPIGKTIAGLNKCCIPTILPPHKPKRKTARQHSMCSTCSNNFNVHHTTNVMLPHCGSILHLEMPTTQLLRDVSSNHCTAQTNWKNNCWLEQMLHPNNLAPSQAQTKNCATTLNVLNVQQ